MKPQNILSIDYGTHKVGFARTLECIALPIGISYSREALRDAREYMDRYEITQVIYGYPKNLSGHPELNVIKKLDTFIKALQKTHPQALYSPVDERYSTQLARFSLDVAGIDSSEVDDVSAVILLENYLSSH